MTASQIRRSGRRAAGRIAAASVITVAVASPLPAAHATTGDRDGKSNWQLVTGFTGWRPCQEAGATLWSGGGIGQFSCMRGPDGFYLYVK